MPFWNVSTRKSQMKGPRKPAMVLTVLAGLILSTCLAGCGGLSRPDNAQLILGSWYTKPDDPIARAWTFEEDHVADWTREYGEGQYQILDNEYLEFIDYYGGFYLFHIDELTDTELDINQYEISQVEEEGFLDGSLTLEDITKDHDFRGGFHYYRLNEEAASNE